jgi:hypothetical protein
VDMHAYFFFFFANRRRSGIASEARKRAAGTRSETSILVVYLTFLCFVPFWLSFRFFRWLLTFAYNHQEVNRRH